MFFRIGRYSFVIPPSQLVSNACSRLVNGKLVDGMLVNGAVRRLETRLGARSSRISDCRERLAMLTLYNGFRGYNGLLTLITGLLTLTGPQFSGFRKNALK